MAVMTRDEVESQLEDFGDDREAWKAARDLSLGGSDLFPIVFPRALKGGYSSAWALWAQKKHGRKADGDEDELAKKKPWLEYGNDVEPGIVAFAGREMKRNDPTIEVVHYGYTIFRDPTGAPLHVSVDALAYRKPKWELVQGLDAKRVSLFAEWHEDPEDRWGDPGTSVMPRRCQLQGLSSCLLFGVPTWTFAADRGTVPELFPLSPTGQEMTDLRELGTNWWDRYMIGDEEPPIDGSEATTEAMKAMFDESASILLPATDEDLDLLQDLRDAKVIYATAKEKKDALENQLKRRIGNDARGIAGVANWGWCKGRRGLDADAMILSGAEAFAREWIAPALVASGVDPDTAQSRAVAEALVLMQAARETNTKRGSDYRRLTLTK